MSEYNFAQTQATEEPSVATIFAGTNSAHLNQMRLQEESSNGQHQHSNILNDYIDSGLIDLAQELLNETQQFNQTKEESSDNKKDLATMSENEVPIANDYTCSQQSAFQVNLEQQGDSNHLSVLNRPDPIISVIKDSNNLKTNKNKSKNNKRNFQNDENSSDKAKSIQNDETKPPKAKRKYKPSNQRRNIKYNYLRIFFLKQNNFF
jgi:hypothetical protein